MSGADDDVALASGAREAAVTLATLSSGELAPLLQAWAQALPDQARGDPTPPFGELYFDVAGHLVVSGD